MWQPSSKAAPRAALHMAAACCLVLVAFRAGSGFVGSGVSSSVDPVAAGRQVQVARGWDIPDRVQTGLKIPRKEVQTTVEGFQAMTDEELHDVCNNEAKLMCLSRLQEFRKLGKPKEEFKQRQWRRSVAQRLLKKRELERAVPKEEVIQMASAAWSEENISNAITAYWRPVNMRSSPYKRSQQPHWKFYSTMPEEAAIQRENFARRDEAKKAGAKERGRIQRGMSRNHPVKTDKSRIMFQPGAKKGGRLLYALPHFIAPEAAPRAAMAFVGAAAAIAGLAMTSRRRKAPVPPGRA